MSERFTGIGAAGLNARLSAMAEFYKLVDLDELVGIVSELAGVSPRAQAWVDRHADVVASLPWFYEPANDTGAENDDDYVELTGNDIPYRLRPDAPPLAACNRCHRQAWDEELIGTEDRMPQPDGNPCGGRFEELLGDE